MTSTHLLFVLACASVVVAQRPAAEGAATRPSALQRREAEKLGAVARFLGAPAAGRSADAAVEAGMNALAAATVWRLGAQYLDAASAPPGAFIVVNTFGIERTEGVIVRLRPSERGGRWVVHDAFNRAIPSQAVEDAEGQGVAFLAAKVPPHGARTFRLAKAGAEGVVYADTPQDAPPSPDPVLENVLLRAVVDGGTGRLKSFGVGRARRELLASSDGAASESRPTEIDVVESGPVRTMVRVQEEAGVVEYVLWRGASRFERSVSASASSRPCASAPPTFDAAVLRFDVSAESVLGRPFEFPPLAKSADAIAVAVFESGSRTAFVPMIGPDLRALLLLDAAGLSTPLRVARVRPEERSSGGEPPQLNSRVAELGRMSWVTCEDPSSLVDEVRLADDGAAWSVRVADYGGVARKVLLAFPFDVASARLENADGSAAPPVAVQDDRLVAVPLPPYGAATVRIVPTAE